MAMLVVGIVIGLLIGVLPGLTLVMGVALALPFTYKMDVTASIVLLTAMYVSGTYGGAFTAILFRIPGEPIDVPMLWDGYTMARKGKPAKALGWTLVAALGGGLLSAVVMVALTEPLAKFALRFSSPEYFAIVLFGLLSVVALGGGSLANAFISLSVGLLIATVGTDPIYGADRFTFGSPILADGIEFLVVMVGAYGVGEVLTRLETGFATKPLDKISNARTELPTLARAERYQGDVPALIDRRRPHRPRAGRRRHHRVVRELRHRGAVRQTQEPDGHRHRRRHRRAAGGGHRLGRRRAWCRCSRSAFPAAARPRSFSAPSCCTAFSPDRRCS